MLAAAVQPTADSRSALAVLCHRYWHPIYAFIRRNGYDQDQAQDLTQDFFAVLLEKDYLRAANRQRGRFRSFLLTAVKHFLFHDRERMHALKRGGGQRSVSIDAVGAETWYAPAAVDGVTPETLFERRWAVSLLEQVMAKLRTEFADLGKAGYFDRLSGLLNGDTRDTRYEAIASELGVSAGSLRTSVHRMRRKYRDLLRAEIAETVSTAEEIDDEIRFLLMTLSG